MADEGGKPIHNELFDRYFAGECTPEEIAEVQHWLETTPGGPALTSVLQRLSAQDSRAVESEAAIAQRWLAFERQLDALSGDMQERALPPNGRSRAVAQGRGQRLGSGHALTRRHRLIVSVLGIAVACVVAVIAMVPNVLHVIRGGPRVMESRTYTTASTQQLRIVLDDGSAVVLAPETRLRYAVDDQGARSIELTGEALFTVTPHANRPFVVHTGTITTRVLGTTFSVRRYAGEHATQVAVVSGRVATSGRHAPAVLAAGAVGYATDSSVTVTSNDAADVTAWTQGRIIFRKVPVAMMLATLSRWYGYSFRLTDTTLASSHVSGAFRTDHPAEALNAMKVILGVTMTFDGNVITLRPEHGGDGLSQRSNPRNVLSHPEPEVGR